MFAKSQLILVIALALTGAGVLSACGQKGDLYLPPGKAAAGATTGAASAAQPAASTSPASAARP